MMLKFDFLALQISKAKNPGKSDDNAHKIKQQTKQENNSCIQNRVKKALKKKHKKNDFTSNEEINVINKFRSLSISDNSSNDK
eukprot:7753599-Ditylum_brightwellii.AAC.1